MIKPSNQGILDGESSQGSNLKELDTDPEELPVQKNQKRAKVSKGGIRRRKGKGNDLVDTDMDEFVGQSLCSTIAVLLTGD